MAPSQSATVESINDFSDEILIHILSFLPIKQAFKTSILSKRWLPLCHSLPDLHINDRGVKNTKDWILFCRQMDEVMFSPRSHHVRLKSFHLQCCSEFSMAKDDCFRFDKWIQAAKRRHIQDLSLYLLYVPMSRTIFCCKTLVVLKLTNMVTVFRCSSVDLPLLKTLYLYCVRFDDTKNLMKLISRCPLLENLKTSYVKARVGITATGYTKPLFNLINAEIRMFEVPLRAIYNVKFLRVFEMGRSLPNEEINSYYKGFPVFENLTELQLHWCQGIHDWDEVVKMLQNCPKLQTLLIAKAVHSITKEDWKQTYEYDVPECVSSHLKICKIVRYEALEADFRFATYILQNARLLQDMTILHTKQMETPQFLEDLSSYPWISRACNLSISKAPFGPA
ncbi:hypothetical protein P8452_43037 [Trifolium repens]|nr:hypothetical protein P8452_43037 [Trifolium repens]